MFALCLVVIVSLPSVIGETNSVMIGAVNHALANSFNKSTRFLGVTIQTDFDDNRIIFLDMFDEILKEKWEFRVQLDVNNESNQSLSDTNLWFIDSYEAFRRLYPLIRAHRGDFPVYYLIVMRLKKYDKSFAIMQKIFSDMLALMHANVNIMIESADEEVLFYTFFPYRETACRSTAPISINRFSNKTLTSSLIFPSKIQHINGCPIRVIPKTSVSFIQIKKLKKRVVLKGLEGEILNELAKRMNCSWKIVRSYAEAKVLSNLTTTGPFLKLYNGETDIVIGAYFHDTFQDQVFTPSTSYLYTFLVIAVRRPPYRLPKLSWLLAAFDDTTWVCFLMLLVVTAAGITLVRKNSRLKKVFRLQPNQFKYLDILVVAMGMAVKHLPTKNSLRLSFIIWSLGVLIIRAAYQGKLFDSYRRLNFIRAPSTVRELLDDHYTIYSLLKYSHIMNQLSGIGKVNYKALNSYKTLTTTGKNAVIGSKSLILEYLTTKDLENLVTEPLLSQQVCMFFQQHSIIAPRVNAIILWMMEAGIMKHWSTQYMHLKAINIKPLVTYVPGPITMQRFSYIVLSFATLYMAAILVFVVELTWARLQKV